MANETTAALLRTFLEDVRTIRYSELASSTIIVFDHLITLDQEYNLIWTSSWTLGKCLFLVNRYYTLLTLVFNNFALFSPNMTDSLCLSWYMWQGWTGVIAFVIAEMILQLRLYALYLLDKRVLAFMVMFSLCAAAASASVMGSVLSQITATAHPFPGHNFCVVENVSDHFYAFWIPMLASESVLCGLAVYRFMQNHRSRSTLFQTGRRLVENLIRDSVFYFVVMFAAYFTNTLIFIFGAAAKMEIPIGFAVALSCVMGNRLCLNVRGMVRGEDPLPSESDLLSESSDDVPVFTVEGGTPLSAMQMTELRSMRSMRSVRSGRSMSGWSTPVTTCRRIGKPMRLPSFLTRQRRSSTHVRNDSCYLTPPSASAYR